MVLEDLCSVKEQLKTVYDEATFKNLPRYSVNQAYKYWWQRMIEKSAGIELSGVDYLCLSIDLYVGWWLGIEFTQDPG